MPLSEVGWKPTLEVRHLPTSPHISPHLRSSPHISPHLPPRPRPSLTFFGACAFAAQGAHTTPSTFALVGDARSEVHQDALRKQRQEEEASARRAAAFKAKPAKVLAAPDRRALWCYHTPHAQYITPSPPHLPWCRHVAGARRAGFRAQEVDETAHRDQRVARPLREQVRHLPRSPPYLHLPTPSTTFAHLTCTLPLLPFANSANRQERRKVLETEMSRKRQQIEAMAEQKAQEAAVEAAKAIAQLR